MSETGPKKDGVTHLMADWMEESYGSEREATDNILHELYSYPVV